MNMISKHVLLTLALIFSFNAHSDVNWMDYSQDAYSMAKKNGKTIIVGFHKKGCPTCSVQDKHLENAGINKIKNLVALRVEQRDPMMKSVYEQFGLTQQQWAAAVLIKGGSEVARIKPGVTDETEIMGFVKKAQ